MELFLSYWPWLIAAAAFALHLLVSVHIVFYKRDTRAATAWIAIVWFSPFLGSLLYYLLGINRIERRARKLRGKVLSQKPPVVAMGVHPVARIPALPSEVVHLTHFVQLEHGCRIWIMPGPFTHTKLMLMDGLWTMLGSANWDARSLRLNFEFNIECYDLALAASLESSLKKTFAQAEQMTLTNLDHRSFLAKLRNGVARLLMPYL